MQAQDDRRKVTPPAIDELFDSIRSKTPQRSDTDQLVNPSNPKLYVIHSHGSSLDNVFQVKVPIVCGVKEGESHRRVTASRMEGTRERTVNSSMVDIMNRNIQLLQYEEQVMAQHGTLSSLSRVDQVFEAAKMLVTDDITASLPVKYEIGENMQDIKLFCRGLSMHDGIYAIDLVTHEIQQVAKVFGLDVISEAKRKPSTPLENLHSSRYHDILWKEYDDIVTLKTQLQKKEEVSEQEKNEYVRRIETYNNLRLAGKGVKKLSRIRDSTQGCVSLSRLIQTGISKGIIVPTKDCFSVFACRKHHVKRDLTPPPPPPIQFTTKRISHSEREESASKRRGVGEGGSTRKRSRKLNKKTRRVKMRLNKTKSRKHKI